MALGKPRRKNPKQRRFKKLAGRKRLAWARALAVAHSRKLENKTVSLFRQLSTDQGAPVRKN